MPVMILDAMPRLEMSLGHQLAMTASASLKWRSSLPDTNGSEATLKTFKKPRAGSCSYNDITALPKVILSKEASAAAKNGLRRDVASAVGASSNQIKSLDTVNDKKALMITGTEGNNPSWGIFISRESFLDMHIY